MIAIKEYLKWSTWTGILFVWINFFIQHQMLKVVQVVISRMRDTAKLKQCFFFLNKKNNNAKDLKLFLLCTIQYLFRSEINLLRLRVWAKTSETSINIKNSKFDLLVRVRVHSYRASFQWFRVEFHLREENHDPLKCKQNHEQHEDRSFFEPKGGRHQSDLHRCAVDKL